MIFHPVRINGHYHQSITVLQGTKNNFPLFIDPKEHGATYGDPHHPGNYARKETSESPISVYMFQSENGGRPLGNLRPRLSQHDPGLGHIQGCGDSGTDPAGQCSAAR